MARERPEVMLTPELCKGCGRCIEACPKHAIALGTEINQTSGLVPVQIDHSVCNDCGLCLSACPEPYGLGNEVYELEDPAKLYGPRKEEVPAAEDIASARIPLPSVEPLLLKGNYAAAIGALLAGCRHVFGYPITPSTEGAELMAKVLPQLDGVFIQAVSEVATVNHMYGCGGAGLPLHDLHRLPRLLPHARGHVLHDRRRVARRLRRRSCAADPASATSGPSQADIEAWSAMAWATATPRPSSWHRPPPGDPGPDDAGLRADLQIQKPRRHPGRWLPGPDQRHGPAARTPW